jgi:nucleoside-diphosphate-sugar epimerase
MNTDLTGQRVALIGGAGFIGHSIALQLQKLGAEPHVIDSLQVNNLGAFTNGVMEKSNKQYVSFINERLNLLRQADIPLHIVDARDYPLLSRHLGAISPHVVIHLAAVAHANRANKDPYSTFDHSLRTLENALDSVRDQKPHFIYFSSSMVYGNFEGDAVSEDSPCEPLGIYGALKFAGEKLVLAYHQVFDLSYTIVRPSALYGERCVSRRVGQAFIENAIRGRDIAINGDGTDTLDFTYISDLVQGIVLCISKKEARNQIFNLTYGCARSLNCMAELLRAHFPAVRVLHQPRDRLMPERGTLSIAKARKLLGYEPAFPLERGFVSYIQWYKELAAENPALFELGSVHQQVAAKWEQRVSRARRA